MCVRRGVARSHVSDQAETQSTPFTSIERSAWWLAEERPCKVSGRDEIWEARGLVGWFRPGGRENGPAWCGRVGVQVSVCVCVRCAAVPRRASQALGLRPLLSQTRSEALAWLPNGFPLFYCRCCLLAPRVFRRRRPASRPPASVNSSHPLSLSGLVHLSSFLRALCVRQLPASFRPGTRPLPQPTYPGCRRFNGHIPGP